jgi:multiple sugar transport system permease protein
MTSDALPTSRPINRPPGWRRQQIAAVLGITLIIAITIVYLIPVLWIVLTSLKQWEDVQSVPPRFVFPPTLDNYTHLGVNRVFDQSGSHIAGDSGFFLKIANSAIIGLVSTFFAVGLGLLSAYAFSRFRVKGKNDLLFFILSTRMMPPVVVVIPIYLMYGALGLRDTYLGMILLYTVFNLSFAVWLLKGFVDEIPREYEDAALVDGYTRFQAFCKVVLPQCVTGIAATAVFCLITAWNEFAFALILTDQRAVTAPPFIVSRLGSAGTDWGQIAASTVIFVLPIAVFTFLMRNHLLRGITFGAIKK